MFCKQCGGDILADDVHLGNQVAKCRACNAVFSFAEGLTAAAATKIRPLAGQPRNVRVDDDGIRLQFTRRWFTPILFGALFFCIAWDSFLIFWYSMALGGAGPSGGFGLLFVIFPIAHVAVGVGMTYYVIAGFLNTTRITIDANELSIRHGPVPWWGNQMLAVDDIRQLYVEESASRNDNATTRHFHLSAVTADGAKIRLLSNLEGADEAAYFEQTIEARLGIADERVAGESRA